MALYVIFVPSTGYDCCGVAVSEDDLAALRADMGVLNERRWQVLDWEIPADEACPCWWITTVDGPSPSRLEPPAIM